MHDLPYAELLRLTAMIRAREISASEATEAMLARIAALDGSLRSYLTLMPEAARAAARAADEEIARGVIRGPLHGAPIAVKDLCWTAGTATSGGMTIYRDFLPPEDATVTARLRAAGAVILGKLMMTEGAYSEHHPALPTPANPWNAAHWAGSSSSGSGIAVAAGLCYGSLGSDTGGSIRFPSAANGVTGIKGTWGRVSRHGVFELAATLDHVGPMARSARDAGALLGAIAGPDAKDPTAADVAVPDYLAASGHGLAGLRIGIDERWCRSGIDAETAAMMDHVEAVLRDLGAVLVPVAMPATADVVRDWFPLCAVEVAVAHEATYPARRGDYGPRLSALIEQGQAVSGMDYQRIVLRRLDFAGRLAAVFHEVDLLLAPVQPVAAPSLARLGEFGADQTMIETMLTFTCPFDMSRNPTITLPGGFTAGGCPIGFQFIGAHWQEALLVRAGAAFQDATDWHRRHPPLADH